MEPNPIFHGLPILLVRAFKNKTKHKKEENKSGVEIRGGSENFEPESNKTQIIWGDRENKEDEMEK